MSASRDVLRCLLALPLSSGGTIAVPDLIPDDSPQCFCASAVSQMWRGRFASIMKSVH